jgi:CheY-like chemotaxis protein
MIKAIFLDDESDLVEYLPKLVKSHGIEMLGFTDISQALSVFVEQDINAVLLDIMMKPTNDMDPEELEYGMLTGVEVLRRMKKLKPAIPVVAFTVLTNSTVKQLLRREGIVEFVNKPAEPDDIARILLNAAKH